MHAFSPAFAAATPTAHHTASLQPLPGQLLSLAQLTEGQDGHVVHIGAAGIDGEQLMEMGLTPGTRVRLVLRGAGNTCLQLELRGYKLVVLRAHAAHIAVSLSPPTP